MVRLRRSDPHRAGLTRVRRGRGFEYRDLDGSRIVDGELLARIRALAIPPAWTDVWICPDDAGHLQATGIDDAGRRQYLYHEDWHARRAQVKFARAQELARRIPAARRSVTRDLRTEGPAPERVLAGAFRMLDTGLLRIGSTGAARDHGTIGLTTLRGRHAAVHEGRLVRLRFIGKSGQPWSLELEDPDLARLVSELKRRGPDARLLAWREHARWHAVTPAEINDDIRRRTAIDVTAKDFRTLQGTIVAARVLARIGPVPTASGRRRAAATAVRAAAEALGNTPAVARASYVDPRLFDLHDRGVMVDPARRIEPQLVRLLGGA